MAALLPMAAAFRELLVLRTGATSGRSHPTRCSLLVPNNSTEFC